MTFMRDTNKVRIWALLSWKIFGLGFRYTPFVACAHIQYSSEIDIYLPFFHINFTFIK